MQISDKTLNAPYISAVIANISASINPEVVNRGRKRKRNLSGSLR